MFLTIFGTAEEDAWIGLSDNKTEGRFVYLDGAAATQQNTGWRSEQPDDFRGGEDCVHVFINGIFNNTANDWECYENAFALCEKPL